MGMPRRRWLLDGRDLWVLVGLSSAAGWLAAERKSRARFVFGGNVVVLLAASSRSARGCQWLPRWDRVRKLKFNLEEPALRYSILSGPFEIPPDGSTDARAGLSPGDTPPEC